MQIECETVTVGLYYRIYRCHFLFHLVDSTLLYIWQFKTAAQKQIFFVFALEWPILPSPH